jgi:ornithine carbamoyltransferase
MLNHHALWSLDGLTRNDLLTLVGRARQFERAAGLADGRPAPLRGKNLALLSDDHASADAAAFLRAATELGAHVARVRATEPGAGGRRDPRDTAGLLGQLYDAIECQGLPEGEWRQLDRDAGVPVFNGIASAGHPLQKLAALMTWQELCGDATLPSQLPPDCSLPAETLARNHHHLLQAALSCALA